MNRPTRSRRSTAAGDRCGRIAVHADLLARDLLHADLVGRFSRRSIDFKDFVIKMVNDALDPHAQLRKRRGEREDVTGV